MMSSSMLAGEKRWASARRGGMTVLGKVAVPKPINLPSQRLENHGLDPNVEIVPKGTLSWGSRSTAPSNAWGSSSLSPSADGGTNSPGHLGGRPSSGGSGTRPSTAGSDRTHEPTSSAWGSNSRPSSSSGAMTLSQTSSTSLRPRSAETRPNSSQLSRFAEPVSESPISWGPNSAVERLGMKASKEDGFSLSSGDFPTLGSDRENSGKNNEPQGHGSHSRPSSASGRMDHAEEKTATSQADVKNGTVNTWKRDSSQSGEDVVHPGVEKWHGEPQQFFNPNIPPQHFDAWRGPPVNAPSGVWYRGPPGGPPFGAPVPPGGYPVEPFPYYRPQMPPPALASSQPVPPPRPGPRGPRPKTGDLYRPQMPDAYPRPGMPFRPGFYPGPMPFEGYYGPPMGYCNANERDVSYMGMPSGPPVYNRYSGPNASDPTNSHPKVAGHNSTGKSLSENMETSHTEEIRGPQNQNEWDEKGGENWGHKMPSHSYPGKGGQHMISSRKREWGADDGEEENMSSRTIMPIEDPAWRLDPRVFSTETVNVKSFEGIHDVKVVNDIVVKKSETASSSPPDMPQQLPAVQKDPALLQKIEGLNAKVRASDGRYDISYSSNREEQQRRYQITDAKIRSSTIEAHNTSRPIDKTSVSGDLGPAIHGVIASAGDKMTQPTAVMSRRPHHMGQSISTHSNRGNTNYHDAGGWHKRPNSSESSGVVTASDVTSASSHARDHNVVEAVKNPPGKDEKESSIELYDSADSQAQRARMRELAKQRALQLQKEEEERNREQRAKALAKLEELNRRTLAVEPTTQDVEKTQVICVKQQQQLEKPRAVSDMMTVPSMSQASASVLVTDPDVNEIRVGASQTGEPANSSADLSLEALHSHQLESVPQQTALPVEGGAYNASAAKAASQVSEGTYRQKRSGGKQKHNTPSHKNLNEKSVPHDASEAPKDLTNTPVSCVAMPEVVSNEVRPNDFSENLHAPNTVAESSTQAKRKSNRSSKSRQKLDEAPTVPAVPTTVAKDSSPTNNEKPNTVSSDLGTSATPSVIEPDVQDQAPDVPSSLPNEEARSKVSNQWRPHQSRRMPKSQQTNRSLDRLHSSETVKWAPVRSLSKVEDVVETSQKSLSESIPAKTDNMVPNNSKTKRAEMERYVPKPVAKELAQQGSGQPALFLSSPPIAGDATGIVQTGAGDCPQGGSSSTRTAGSSIEFKEGDGRRNKHGKAQGTWRQRSSSDSLNLKGNHGPNPTSDLSKDAEKALKENQPRNESTLAEAEPKTASDVAASESGDLPGDTDRAAASRVPTLKDQGLTGRGKRHLSRGHKSTGNYHEHSHEKIIGSISDQTCTQSAARDVNQIDEATGTKEHCSSGERMSSKWQPKSHGTSANNKPRNGASRDETGAAENNKVTKDFPRKQRVHIPSNDKMSMEVDRPCPDTSVSENKNVAEEPDLRHQQDFRREKKVIPPKGRPYSPNQAPSGTGNSAPGSADCLHEPNFSSGFRRFGSQNNRPSRGNEFRGDWSSGQDNRQQNQSRFQERGRQNVHYEYQPVGLHSNDRPDKLEVGGDGPNNVGPRYRERGQGHSKRGGGNFHGRQVRVDARND